MKKLIASMIILIMVFSILPSPAFAVNTATHGKITEKSAVSGIFSFLL